MFTGLAEYVFGIIEICASNLIGATNGSPGFVENRPIAILDYGRRHQ